MVETLKNSSFLTSIIETLEEEVKKRNKSSRIASKIAEKIKENDDESKISDIISEEIISLSGKNKYYKILSAKLLRCYKFLNLKDLPEKLYRTLKILFKDPLCEVWLEASFTMSSLILFPAVAKYLNEEGKADYGTHFERRSLASLGHRYLSDPEGTNKILEDFLHKIDSKKSRDQIDLWTLRSFIYSFEKFFLKKPEDVIKWCKNILSLWDKTFIKTAIVLSISNIIKEQQSFNVNNLRYIKELFNILKDLFNYLRDYSEQQKSPEEIYSFIEYKESLVKAIYELLFLKPELNIEEEIAPLIHEVNQIVRKVLEDDFFSFWEQSMAVEQTCRLIYEQSLSSEEKTEYFNLLLDISKKSIVKQNYLFHKKLILGLWKITEEKNLSGKMRKKVFDIILELDRDGYHPVARIYSFEELLVALKKGLISDLLDRDEIIEEIYKMIEGSEEVNYSIILSKFRSLLTFEEQALEVAEITADDKAEKQIEAIRIFQELEDIDFIGTINFLNRFIQKKIKKDYKSLCSRIVSDLTKTREREFNCILKLIYGDYHYFIKVKLLELLHLFSDVNPSKVFDACLYIAEKNIKGMNKKLSILFEECLFRFCMDKNEKEKRKELKNYFNLMMEKGCTLEIIKNIKTMARDEIIREIAFEISQGCSIEKGEEKHVVLKGQQEKVKVMVYDSKGRAMPDIKVEFELTDEEQNTTMLPYSISNKNGKAETSVKFDSPGDNIIRAYIASGQETVFKIKVIFDIGISGFSVSENQRYILCDLYKDYPRIDILKKFGEGYSSAIVLLVLPYDKDNTLNDLQVVKIGPSLKVRMEKENFDSYVKLKIPANTPKIIDYSELSGLGGINYTFAGFGYSSSDKIYSFKDYYKKNNVREIKEIIEKLLRDSLGPGWYCQSNFHKFTLISEYGYLFPATLTLDIKPDTGSEIVSGTDINGEDFKILNLKELTQEYNSITEGTKVCIRDFLLKEVDGCNFELEDKDKRVLLNITTDPSMNYSERFQLNESVSIKGIVTGNRHKQIEEAVKNAFPDMSEGISKNEKIVFPFYKKEFSNPLLKYNSILDKVISGKMSVIHGDLHVLNLLIDNRKMPWIIDFGKTRKGHSVFDLIFLEVYIRNWILSGFDIELKDYIEFEETLMGNTAGRTKPLPRKINKELKKACEVIMELRKYAGSYVYDPGAATEEELFDEYLAGVFCTALSVLKYYKHQTERQNQFLFLTASVLCEYISKIKMC